MATNLLDLMNVSKINENGDISFTSTGNVLLDILFMSEFYKTHLDQLPKLGQTEKEKIFSMFIRDPRNGLGCKDVGRKLMADTGISMDDIVYAGRFDDVWRMFLYSTDRCEEALNFLKSQIEAGNQLAKKWMPRYSSKNFKDAWKIAHVFGMNKQDYGHFVKVETTESLLSEKRNSEIIYSHVPSLAMIKYANTFLKKDEERYKQYLQDVRSGVQKLNISTTTCYDIYKNRDKIDAQLFFDQLPKVKGSWVPVIDTSGSMCDSVDSMGKAISIGHYLAKTSTYSKDLFIAFSAVPKILKLGENRESYRNIGLDRDCGFEYDETKSQYLNEIDSMITGDISYTNLPAVMSLLSNLDEFPEYLVILSDMEFDSGSSMSKNKLMELWKQKGYTTKIVWWNFNNRNKTVPEMDNYGNIFFSGYNPMLLSYLQAGFNGEQFLDELLAQYSAKLLKR